MSATPSPSMPASRPGARMRRWIVYPLIGCLGAGVLSVLLCCGSVGWILWYRDHEMHNLMANNEVVREHLGELESCTMSPGEVRPKVVEGLVVVELRGSKGTAKADVIPIETHEKDVFGTLFGFRRVGIQSGELIMPDGTRYPLVPEAGDGKASADGSSEGKAQTKSEAKDPFQDS